MLSLPAHDLWAEYSFPLHACFYHVLERPQSWCFQWNTCILIIRVNKCFIWNSLLVNTLMVHKMCDEKQQCVGRWQNMAHVQSPVSHAESGERSRKQMYILLFLPLLWLPLITESRETWLQRLCSGDELAGPQSRLRMVGREFAFQSCPSLTSKYLSNREGRNRGDSEGGQEL